MFDEFTEEYFMDQARQMGDALGVDTREGSVYMDAAAGHCIRAAKFYEDLRNMFNMLAADTCSGDVLDEWAKLKRIYRKNATPSYYIPIFEGVAAADMIGNRFMVDGYYFVLVQEANGFYLQSEIAGTETNYLLKGTTIIPVRNTMGLISASLGEMYAAGTDRENDDDLRRRWQKALSEPSKDWNKAQYKTTCEEYDGIGRAIIFPLAYGDGTVKAVLISAEGTAPPASLIEKIQEEMDPEHEGMGEGKVLIGSKFFAEAAVEYEINISFSVVIASGYSLDSIQETVRKELIAYMKGIALYTPDEEDMIVQYIRVISILANVQGINDLADIMLNGVNENLVIARGKIPTLGNLSLNVVSTLRN